MGTSRYNGSASSSQVERCPTTPPEGPSVSGLPGGPYFLANHPITRSHVSGKNCLQVVPCFWQATPWETSSVLRGGCEQRNERASHRRIAGGGHPLTAGGLQA